jgi:hypothetical protein
VVVEHRQLRVAQAGEQLHLAACRRLPPQVRLHRRAVVADHDQARRARLAPRQPPVGVDHQPRVLPLVAPADQQEVPPRPEARPQRRGQGLEGQRHERGAGAGAGHLDGRRRDAGDLPQPHGGGPRDGEEQRV